MSKITNTGYANLITNNIPMGTYTNASGALWLSIRTIATSYNYPPSNTAGTSGVTYATVLITDYRSGSNIAVTQFQDGEDDNNKFYNHFYSITVSLTLSIDLRISIKIFLIELNEFFFSRFVHLKVYLQPVRMY